MNMGDRIKKLRLEKGLTQEELGKMLGVQKAAIQKYEKGYVENLKRSAIIKLANLFSATPSYLMGWEEEEGKAPDNIYKIETKKFPKNSPIVGLNYFNSFFAAQAV